MADQPPTRFDRSVCWLKNHKFASIIVLLGATVIAIGSLTDAVLKIKGALWPTEAKSTATPTAAQIDVLLRVSDTLQAKLREADDDALRKATEIARLKKLLAAIESQSTADSSRIKELQSQIEEATKIQESAQQKADRVREARDEVKSIATVRRATQISPRLKRILEEQGIEVDALRELPNMIGD